MSDRAAIYRAEEIVVEECEKARTALVMAIRARIAAEEPMVVVAEPCRPAAYSVRCGPKPIAEFQLDVNTYTMNVVLPVVNLEIDVS